MNYRIVLPLVGIIISNGILAQSTHKLWYDEPAQYFEETMVLGNGKMGASVFGGVETDKIWLNDITLWSGGPVNPAMNPEAYKAIPEIRQALKNEDYKLADELQHKVQGKFSESYAPLGTMLIHFKHNGEPQNYYRELDLENAISKVAYTVNGVSFSREYFVSFPDKIMIINLTSGKKGSLNFDINLNSILKYSGKAENDHLTINGYAPAVAQPSYLGNMVNAVVFDEKTGTRFSAMVKVQNNGGRVVLNDSVLSLTGATNAVIYVSVATSFNGFDKDPVKEGIDYHKLASEQLNNAMGKSIRQIREDHLKDYQRFYNRVQLNLGSTGAPEIPTDERLMRYAAGAEDKNLEVLYFQYGRYLLISSSRTPGVPANLQGLWNPYIRPPWSCNYTTNINLEENYWLAENTNLSEMHEPLLHFIKNISLTGAVTARTFFGVNGWAACHNSDIWAMSNPVGDFGHGDPLWANWYMGGAWLSTHLWEHYQFTHDLNWLRNEGYVLMKGAARFCLEWLTEDSKGFLITSPSTSPENRYITSTGYHGATLYGGTADIAMARECMQQTLDAARILNTDPEFCQQLESALKRLRPYMIGSKGNLMEWYHDWEDEDPQHRHQTHLFGLYPGHHITPAISPDIAEACRQTLEIKGDETTGWSKGWRINLWARLWDGNHAYKMYRELLRYVEPDGKRTQRGGGGGTYPNLFDAHPPFQIDGNFGGAAAVAEMLLQSGNNEIRLLPALPDAWSEGSVKGLCARGGIEVSMRWSGGKLTTVTLVSKSDISRKVITGDKEMNVDFKAGEPKKLDF